MNCLVVDDDLMFAELVAVAANSEDVRIAPTMQDAIAMIDRQPPDYVVLDLSLPDSKAGETMELIRELKERAKGATIIVITGDNREQTRMDALRRGADIFMVKGSGKEWFDRVAAQLRSPRNQPCSSRETVEAIERTVAHMTGAPASPIDVPRQSIRILMRIGPMLGGGLGGGALGF